MDASLVVAERNNKSLMELESDSELMRRQEDEADEATFTALKNKLEKLVAHHTALNGASSSHLSYSIHSY